jgi:hypothetical protein
MNKLEMGAVIVLIALYIVFRVSILLRTYRRQRNRLGASPQTAAPKNTNAPFH